MMELPTPELEFAAQAVRRAALLARRIRRDSDLQALSKEDFSPVTVADYACQALVGALLETAFPGDAFVAEEDSQALGSPGQAGTLERVAHYCRGELPAASAAQVLSWIDRGTAAPGDRFWTLDPIDGTKGFLRGDQYATALALVVEGAVRLGAIACPNLSPGGAPDPDGDGSLVIAARGGGAWATSLHQPGSFSRLSVSGRSDPAQARMLRSFEAGHTNTGQIGELIDQLGVRADPVRMDSQAKYCVLAGGGGELLVRLLSPKMPDYREKIWDQAAGSIIVEEAGGTMTDLHGRRLDFSGGRTLAHNRGVLASNGLLHPAALSALAAIGA